jgi:hypothetical protein
VGGLKGFQRVALGSTGRIHATLPTFIFEYTSLAISRIVYALYMPSILTAIKRRRGAAHFSVII